MLKNSAIILSGNLLARILGLLSTLIVARILVPEDYGIIAACLIVQDFATRLQKLGIQQNIVTHHSENDEMLSAAFALRFSFALVVTILVYFGADVAADFLEKDEVRPVLELICWSFLIQGFFNLNITLQEKRQNFLPGVLTIFFAKLISVVVTIYLAITLNNYWALAIGMIVSDIAQVTLSYVFAKPYKPKLATWHELKDMMGFSKWIFLYQNVDFFNAKYFQIIISKVFDTKILGYFSLGSSLTLIYVSQVSSAIDKANLSHLSDKLKNINKDERAIRVAENLNYVSDLKNVLIIPAYICVAAYPELLISIVLGPNWLEMAPFLTAFSMSMIIIGHNYTLVSIHTSLRQPKICFHSSVIRSLCMIPLGIVAIYISSPLFLAYSSVAITVIGALYLLVYLSRQFGIEYFSSFYRSILYQFVKIVACLFFAWALGLPDRYEVILLLSLLLIMFFVEYKYANSEAYKDLYEHSRSKLKVMFNK